MQLNIFKKSALAQLQADIQLNMGRYSENEEWIDEYFAERIEGQYYRSTGMAVADIDLKIGGPETDADNAIILYEALKDTLNPRIASDLRLWAYLTHKDFYKYMVTRWQIAKPDPTDESEEGASKTKKIYDRINNRYFFGASNGKAFVRQGISRLYWSAYLTYDPSNSDPYEMTRYFLDKQDCFVASTERTLARNHSFLIEALRVLKDKGDINRLDTRAYFAEVNKACGIEILDSLSKTNAYDLCEKSLEYVMNLPAVANGSKIKAMDLGSGKIIGFTENEKGTYLGKTLIRTSPKNIKGLRLGNRFTSDKNRFKLMDIAN